MLAISLLVSPAISQERLLTKPEVVGVSSEKVGELSKYMQSLVDKGKIAGGVTMMARRGKVVHLKAVGMADREAEKRMTTDAIFRIASMTKPITSVAAMMLWEQGKIGLDDPISKYIPEFKNPEVLVSVGPLVTRPAKREITIRHLLTQTSGLGYPSTEGIGKLYLDHDIKMGLCSSNLTLKEMMERTGKLPIKFDPGSQWLYGMSSDVLGRVIEVASGKTFDVFVEKEICEPLGMTDTFFIAPPEKQSRVVAAYYLSKSQIKKVKVGDTEAPFSSDCHLEGNKCFSGGGGLCSTAEDYMRFCQMLLNGGELNGKRLLKLSTVEMMTTNQLEDSVVPNQKMIPGLIGDFGFGLTFYSEDFPTIQLRGAYAWFGVWTTSFRVSPKRDWIVITMTQLAPCKGVVAWMRDYEKIAAESIID
ncbi:serine hydrolase domain-containing protein [Novipirellula artificiosorum]|uniref:serine hydrolase domain-containing protein n=1 Tax=Novipirellula artificiosorum TaxID=2528016 RepID=UPI0018CF956E|nr:serine hydrolase domain-containing protein [Novipirellula artificiosorum]